MVVSQSLKNDLLNKINLRKMTYRMIDCQHAEAPNCLRTVNLKVKSIQKNVKKNGKYVCSPCIKWIAKQKKLELTGTFLKQCQETTNYLDRNLSGEVKSCNNDYHE